MDRARMITKYCLNCGGFLSWFRSVEGSLYCSDACERVARASDMDMVSVSGEDTEERRRDVYRIA